MNITRWGIVGTGAMGELFVEALLSLQGAKVQAVAARTQERAQEFATRYRIPLASPSIDHLLEQADVDLVYISTPNEYHAEQCLKAIAAGKSVLCEKPFALTAEDAKEVADAARRRGVFCMEAMWMRFSPAVCDALRQAKEGALGRVLFFSGQLGFPHVTDPQDRLFRKPGGGALLDLGVYPVSLAQALLGNPVRIVSSAALASTGVDEQCAAVLSYKDGSQAQIAASLKAKLGNAASLHGDKGVLRFDEPLYFPEGYRILKTAALTTKPKGTSKLAKLRRYPVFRTLAEVRDWRNVRRVNHRTSQSGYAFEAAEAQRCLGAGLLESPEMPLNDTIEVLQIMDRIRANWAGGTLE